MITKEMINVLFKPYNSHAEITTEDKDYIIQENPELNNNITTQKQESLPISVLNTQNNQRTSKFSISYPQNQYNNRRPYKGTKKINQGYLSKEGYLKLNNLLNENYEISSKDNKMSFKVSMYNFLKKLNSMLHRRNVGVGKKGIRLVGSGASFVVSNTTERELNDLDFSFYTIDGSKFYEILEIEEDVIGELLEKKTKIILSRKQVYENFFLDSVKVENKSFGTSRESWSLITIGKKGNQTIDIKFVYKSKRSYAFSSDSFEVVLDSFFTSRSYSTNISSSHHPSILVESIYGNYRDALDHLEHNLLCTIKPEEIRRGIFRYCYELAKGKKPISNEERDNMDKIFTNTFLAEQDIQFEEVLVKFLQKHTSNAQSFLAELSSTLTRSSNGRNLDKYLDIIKKYRTI